jgi:hypothetical protein
VFLLAFELATDVAMKPEIICEWLGLPDDSWPPDHYRLLGLAPGEADAHLIEQRVQQRLESVRRYQMKHPEQATEAMNRLAQAYVCLTEPASKRAYDAALLGGAEAAVAVAESAPAFTPAPDALAWLFGPALTRSRSPSSTPPPLARLNSLTPPEQPEKPKPSEPAELIDPVIAAAQQSAPARCGLGTKRALYKRVLATRHFLSVWNELGKYLESPTRRVSRSADGPELDRLFQEMDQLRRRFPRLIGAAGQPGYLVVVFSEQEDAAKGIRALDVGQREALSRDWSAGRKLLTAHRDFLRQEIVAMRKLCFKDRIARAATAFFTDQPAATFIVLLVLALAFAAWGWFQGG